MDEESEIIDGFFEEKEDRNPLGEELIVKPALCLTCKKDNDPQEEELCILTRLDNNAGEEFVCGAYQKIR
jgi:hypothetical protein